MRRPTVFAAVALFVGLLALPASATVAQAQAANKKGTPGPGEACVIPCQPGPCHVTLWAGQFLDVGEVSVTSDGTDLHVVYAITDPGWSITEIHFYAGSEPPQKSAPGQFPYKFEYLNTQLFEFNIPLADVDDGDGCLYFAAHAVVREVVGFGPPNLEDFAYALPDQVEMSVAWQGPNGDAYFDVAISDGGSLDGTYDDWCIDIDRTITDGQYTADVYSSYETLPDGLLVKPGNLDLINWIINQDFVGQPAACGGAYTMGDVQRAIWTLIDQDYSDFSVQPSAECRIAEIVAAAEANGEGFTPGCSDLIAVILVPVDGSQVTIAQVTFADVEVPCEPILGGGEETAWGGGQCPFRQGWGSYFRCGGLD